MTLTTHAVTGAAIATLFPAYPAVGLTLALLSHYAIDAIPHYDYPLYSGSVNPTIGSAIKIDRAFVRDILTVGADGCLGLLLAFLLFAYPHMIPLAMLGALLGMLPDPLQFAYVHFPHQPLTALFRLHDHAHAKNHLAFSVNNVGRQVLFVLSVLLAYFLILLFLRW